MAKIGSLWVGGPLPHMQQVCLASFIHYGHSITLFVYDMDLKVPEGVVKEDANKIVPEDKVFYHQGQLAGFSDLFRVKMMRKTGLMWVDADTLCLSEYFFEDKDFVFISEWEGRVFAGGVCKMPQSHLALIEWERRIDYMTQTKVYSKWSDLGPFLLTKIVNKHKLSQHAVKELFLSFFEYAQDAIRAWDPEQTEPIMEKLNSVQPYSLTFFSGGMKRWKFDISKIPNKSFIEHVTNKYLFKKT